MDANRDLRTALADAIEDAITESEYKTAQWGADDCALWVANILQKVMPGDPGEAYRGKYSDRDGAYQMIGEKGIIGIVRSAARRFKWKRLKTPSVAVKGDIGVLKDVENGIQVAALKYNGAFWIVRGVVGITLVREDRIKIAWSVG